MVVGARFYMLLNGREVLAGNFFRRSEIAI